MFRLSLISIIFVSSVFAWGASPDAQRKQLGLEKLKAVTVAVGLKREIVEPPKLATGSLRCRTGEEKITSVDPVDGGMAVILVKSYYNKDAKGTVALLPPTGGMNIIDLFYAKTFCEMNLNVLILKSWSHDDVQEVDAGMHDRNTLRAVASVRALLSTIDGPVGLLGTSVGAILGGLVTGLEDRISAAVLIVGGGGMAEIMTGSDEQHLVQLRDARKTKFNITNDADYKKLLEANVVIDPLDFAKPGQGKKIGFLLGEKDTTVPTANQHDLVHVWGDDAEILGSFDTDHGGVIKHEAPKHPVDLGSFLKSNMK